MVSSMLPKSDKFPRKMLFRAKVLLVAVKGFLHKLRHIRRQTIRKIFPFALGSLIIVGPLAYLLITNILSAEAWWDDEWAYRVRVPVTNNTTTQSNVYIQFGSSTVYIDTGDANKFQDDCGDLRFTDNNGQLLQYYIASGCGTSQTTVQVNFESFPAGQQYIYYYYGNPAAGDGFQRGAFSTEASNYTIGTFGSEEKGPHPSAYWAFNEGYGGVANDSSPNSNTADLGGEVVAGPGGVEGPHRVRQEINLINTTITAGGADKGFVLIDTTKYSGTATYYFEVVAKVTSGSGTAVLTYNAGTGSTVSGGSTVTISSITATDYEIYRSASFSPTGAQNAYVSSLTGTGTSVRSARVVIVQESEPITSTQTQIEIGSYDTLKSNTAAAPLSNPKYWKYEATRWNENTAFAAEVVYQKQANIEAYEQTYASGTTTNWTAPTTDTYLVEAWGGGGAGGSSVANRNYGAAGGAGGQYARKSVAVTASSSYSVSVAATRAGPTTATTNGSAGFDTVFSTNVVVAKGGAGGAAAANGTSLGGTGSITGGVGDQVYRGGNGGNGSATDSGGGGGGAGSTGNGGDASLTTAGTGTSQLGGDGGAGLTTTANGNPGAVYGGGGGGARRSTTGGDGAGGYLRITKAGITSTVTIKLQQDDGSFGSWTDVASGTIVNAGTASSPSRVRLSGFTPVDGRHYRIVSLSSNDSRTYDVYNAKIIASVASPSGTSFSQPSSYSVAAQITVASDLFFSPDGANMYVANGTSDAVLQYVLSTPWDIKTTVYDSKSFSVLSQDSGLTGLTFSSDGTKMYISGSANGAVYQYSLSTAWDVSTASYANKSASVVNEEGSVQAVAFSSDGTKMYVVGNIYDWVFQYSLSTAWDVSTASYASKYFALSSFETSPAALAFSSDGTKMYAGGLINNTTFQFTLSTAWDVSTASYASKRFSSAAEFTAVQGIYLKSDGSDLYVLSTSVISQYGISTAWDISTASYDSVGLRIGNQDLNATDLTFSGDGTKVYITGSTGAYQYDLSTAWDLSTASYANKSLSTSVMSSLVFSNDGLKLYLTSNSTSLIYQYNLSTAWDLSTASYSGNSKDVSLEDPFPEGISFSSSGSKMFVVGSQNDTIYQYTLSSSWDLSTASYDSVSLSVSAQESIPESIVFSSDGSILYLAGSFYDRVFQYSLSTSWDLSTATYTSESVSVNNIEAAPKGVSVSADGTKLYLVGSRDFVYQLYFQTAWSVKTASLTPSAGYIGDEGPSSTSESITYSTDGTKVYVVNSGTDTVYQYSLSTPWDVSTLSYTSKSLSVNAQDADPQGIFFSSDGTKFYMSGNITDSVYQYSLSTAWDISTATYSSNSFSLAGQTSTAGDIFFTSTGEKMFAIGTGAVYSYTLGTPWDILTLSYDSVSASLNSWESIVTGFTFSSDGKRFYALGTSADSIFQYDLSVAYDITTLSYDSVFLIVTQNYSTPKGLYISPDDKYIYVVGNGTFISSFDVVSSGTSTLSFQTQYLLLNTADTGTDEQKAFTTYNENEWNATENTYYYSQDASNSADSSRLGTVTGTPPFSSFTPISNATATGADHKISTNSFDMPTTGSKVEMEVTNSTGVISAGRIIVDITLSDLSGAGQDDVIEGTATSPTWKTSEDCVSDKCLYFNGSDNAAIAWNTNSVDLGGQLVDGFTVTFWVKASSLGEGDAGHVFNKGADTFVRTSTGSEANKANLVTSIHLTGTNATLTLNNIITLNKWHHVSIGYTNNLTDEIRVYVDGILAGQSTNGSGPPDTNPNPLLIGGTFDHSFHGFIDEFKLYPYERTAAQVKTDAVVGASAKGSAVTFGYNKSLSDGLVGHWKMNEASWNGTSGEVIDASGNSLNATSANSLTTGMGRFGRGGAFDGSDDRIDMPNSALLRFGVTGETDENSVNKPFSLSAWIYPTTSGTVRNIITKNRSAEYDLYLDANNKLVLTIKDYFGNTISATSSKVVAANGWTHVLVSYDGAKNHQGIDMLINGTSDPFSGVTPGTYYAMVDEFSAFPMLVGAKRGSSNTYSGFFTGYIDEVRVYNRKLDTAVAQDLYKYAPSPVAHFKMDENTGTSAVDSAGGLSGTFTGNMDESRWVPGKYGGGLYFNGSDGSEDYLTVTDPASGVLDFKTFDSFTVGFWVKGQPLAERQQFVYKYSTGGYLVQARSSANNGDAYFQIRDETYSPSVDSSGLTIMDGNWHYVTGVRDVAKDTIEIYVDGVLKGTANDTTVNTLENSTNMFIGGTQSYPTTSTMDDVRIYNYARTSQQIVEDMNAGHPAPGSPVGSALSHWKFDEGGGSTVNDSGTAKKAGTITGAVWSNNGKYGHALTFDGSGDYVDFGNQSEYHFGTNSFTLSAWINHNVVSGAAKVILSDGLPTSGWAWQTYSDSFILWHNSVNKITTPSPIVYPIKMDQIDTWYHLAVVRDSSTLSYHAYIDGNLVNSSTEPSLADFNFANSTRIGATSSGTNVFRGLLDEVKMYNSALTADQIKAEYNGGFAQRLGSTGTTSTGTASSAAVNEYCPPGQTTACVAPLGDWRLDEGHGVTAVDTSGNNNNGTLTDQNADGTLLASWVPGKTGGAIQLGADADEVVVVSKNASIKGLTAYTVEAWIYPTAIDGVRHTFYEESIANVNGNTRLKLTIDTDNRLLFGGRGADGESFTNWVDSTTTLNVNTWYHVIAIYNSVTDIHTLYINGIPQTNAQAANTVGTGEPYYNPNIGGRAILGQEEIFKGKIDNVKVFGYARTPEQVAWSFNKGAPIGWWKFDECQGTRAYDSSGNGNIGTITPASSGNTSAGTCGSGTTTEMWNDGTTGKYGASLGFDGLDDNVVVADNAVLQLTGSMTLSTWVKPTTNTLTYGGTILSKLSDSGSRGYQLSLAQSPYTVVFNIATNSTTLYTTTVTYDWSQHVDEWVHIAATYEPGTETKVYVNGQYIGGRTDSVPASQYSNNSQPVRVGARGGGTPSYFKDGLIDDVRIYSYALTPQQIGNMYNLGAVRFE